MMIAVIFLQNVIEPKLDSILNLKILVRKILELFKDEYWKIFNSKTSRITLYILKLRESYALLN